MVSSMSCTRINHDQDTAAGRTGTGTAPPSGPGGAAVNSQVCWFQGPLSVAPTMFCGVAGRQAAHVAAGRTGMPRTT